MVVGGCAMQKLLTLFSGKKISVFEKSMFEILMKSYNNVGCPDLQALSGFDLGFFRW